MNRMQSLASRPKRTLGALAVVLAAVGITVGSGANFTASQANAGNIFSTGKLAIDNEANKVIVTASGMKPGDAPTTGMITVQNIGTLTGTFNLDQTLSGTSNANLANALHLRIVHCNSLAATATTCSPNTGDTNGTGVVYDGTMGGFHTASASGFGLDDMVTGGGWPATNKNRYLFSVDLPSSVNDTDASSPTTVQGKSVTATYTWSAQS